MRNGRAFWMGVLFIFALLFRPPILPIDLIIPLTLISLYGIIRETVRGRLTLKRFFLAAPASSLIRWSIIVTLLVSTSVAVGFATVGEFSFSSTVNASAKLVWTFLLLPINIFYLFILYQKSNVQVNTILKMILYATLIQCAIALVAYTVPAIKDIFVGIMQVNNWDERWTTFNIADQRMNGFAKSLFDTFGYGMGILATVPLILAYRTHNLKFLIALPFILLTILINARTGLIIFSLAIVLFLPLFIRGGSSLLRYRNNIITLGTLAIVIPISVLIIGSLLDSGSSFYERTVSDIGSYLEFIRTGGQGSGDYGGQADVLFSDRYWTLPSSSLQVAMGTGLSVYGGDSVFDFTSDGGYVNSIWYMGLIGLITLSFAFFRFTWRVTRHTSYWRVFSTIAILSVLIFQVKGSAFWSANLGISSIFLVLAVCVYESGLEQGAKNKRVSRKKIV